MTNQTVNRPAPRIGPWYAKFAYVVVACALVYLIAAVPVGPGAAGILRSVLAFVLVVLGARLFRGAGEERLPPRAWWRMTAGVPSGVVLGSLCALVALFSVVGYVGLTVSTLADKDVVDLPVLLVNTVLAAVLAYLYFGSSWRIVSERRARLLAEERKAR
jgi:hypothetical protein